MKAKKIQALIMAVFLSFSVLCPVETVLAEETEHTEEENWGAGEQTEGDTASSVQLSSPSAVLMEASTGTVVYEKDADTPRPPASVTKVMTLLLIFDALEEGSIHLED